MSLKNLYFYPFPISLLVLELGWNKPKLGVKYELSQITHYDLTICVFNLYMHNSKIITNNP